MIDHFLAGSIFEQARLLLASMAPDKRKRKWPDDESLIPPSVKRPRPRGSWNYSVHLQPRAAKSQVPASTQQAQVSKEAAETEISSVRYAYQVLGLYRLQVCSFSSKIEFVNFSIKDRCKLKRWDRWQAHSAASRLSWACSSWHRRHVLGRSSAHLCVEYTGVRWVHQWCFFPQFPSFGTHAVQTQTRPLAAAAQALLQWPPPLRLPDRIRTQTTKTTPTRRGGLLGWSDSSPPLAVCKAQPRRPRLIICLAKIMCSLPSISSAVASS